MKALFFHVPSLGMYNLIEPVLAGLAARGHTVVHYNHAGFARYVHSETIEFRPYAGYQGYLPDLFAPGMGLYDLGLMLVDTAEHLIDVVRAEVRRESPDVLLYSKFMAAPKVVARAHGVPAACLTTGYVFHPRLALGGDKAAAAPSMANVAAIRRFMQRARRFYARTLDGGADVNDIFVNEGDATIVLGLEAFQPGRASLSSSVSFVGPTIPAPRGDKSYEVIYVSLGSIFTANREFFAVCLDALSAMPARAIVSLSDRLSPGEFPHVAPNIELLAFVRQIDVLQRASVFVTHGGASGAYEAIQSGTPMVVIPQIPEQVFHGRKIEELGLGRCIEPGTLTVTRLRETVRQVMDDDAYRRRVIAFRDTLPTAPVETACGLIEALAASRCATSHERGAPHERIAAS
jgi:MGT family glycosyltransferase